MGLLIVLVMLSVIVMCGATAYRMWQSGRAVAEFRAILPSIVGSISAEAFARRVGEPPEDPAHR